MSVNTIYIYINVIFRVKTKETRGKVIKQNNIIIILGVPDFNERPLRVYNKIIYVTKSNFF